MMILLCLALLLSLAACRPEAPASSNPGNTTTAPTNPTQPTTQPTAPPTTEGTQPQGPTKMTFEQFIEQVAGVWVVQSSIRNFTASEYMYTLYTIDAEKFGAGCYPGNVGTNKIVDFWVVDEDMYALNILHEANGFSQEYTETITITFLDADRISLISSFGSLGICIRGGKDLEEAQLAIYRYMQTLGRTFEQFLERGEGVWIQEDSIAPLYDDLYMFNFQTISAESYGDGVYPGGGDRPAKINSFQAKTRDVFELGLYYGPGEFMGEYWPEVYLTLIVTFLEDGRATLKIAGYETVTCIYGGKDLDEAQIAARNYAENNT